MSSSNCYLLTCIQISQEAGQVVWYSYLFHNFPQFIMIHTEKGFRIINKAEIHVFLELSCFFHDPVDVGNLISGSSAFSKTSWASGSSQFTYCWSLAWRILSITLLVCEMSAIVQQLEYSLSLPFFGIGVKTWNKTLCASGPRRRNSDHKEDWPWLAYECSRVSGRGMCWWWPAARSGALSVAVRASGLLKEVAIYKDRQDKCLILHF